MAVVQILSVLALRPLADGAARSAPGRTPDAAAALLGQRFADQSQRLLRALTRANERAWQAFEIAIGGEALLEKCKSRLPAEDAQNLRRQLQAYLAGTPAAVGIAADPFFRRGCLEQLRAAHQAELLLGGGLDPPVLAREASLFLTFADARQLLQAEWRAAGKLATLLEEAGHAELSEFIRLQPSGQPPLLAVAARYFFQRAVVADEPLARALDFARWEQLSPTQQLGFESLERAFAEQGRALAEVLAVGGGLRADVLDLAAELRRSGQPYRELFEKVRQTLERHKLPRRELRDDTALSLQSDDERQTVRGLVEAYRALPEDQRRRMPALLNGLGILRAAAGDLEAAQKDFETVARMVSGDAFARAAAVGNAYRTALRRRRFEEALACLNQAVALDPKRLTPFPTDRYHPERILGAGPFGIVFLCQHQFMNVPVVVRALPADGRDPAVERVFAEAHALRQVDHPALVRVLDCAYCEPSTKARPYLVTEHFAGEPLDEYVKAHGRLGVSDALQVGRQLAEGLQTAHACGLIHRDVRPANVLVRKTVSEPRAGHKKSAGPVVRWEVKLIDFGIPPRTQGDASFAAPEQSGQFPGVAVGGAADVFGWARTVLFALFGTAQPGGKDLRSLPAALFDLLDACQAEQPGERPADFGVVLQRLLAAEAAQKPREAKPATRPAAPAAPPPLPRAAGPRLPVGPPPDLPPLPDDVVVLQTQLREAERNLAALESITHDLTDEQKRLVAEEVARGPINVPSSLCRIAPQVPADAMLKYVALVQRRHSLRRQVEVKLGPDLHARLHQLFDRLHETRGFPLEHWEAWRPTLAERYPLWGTEELLRTAEREYRSWREQADERDWQAARQADTAEAYQGYLVAWRGGKHADEAEASLVPMAQWESARQQDTAEAYERFLDGWSASRFAEEARVRAERLLRDQLLRCPNDPGLRERYLKVRTAAGERRDRRRARLGRWLDSSAYFTLAWLVLGPLGALAASKAFPEWPYWLPLGVAVAVPAGLVSSLLAGLIWGRADGERFAALGPLPWLAYFGSPEKARARYPDS